MEVKNLFDHKAYEETITRLHQLTPASQRRWGKMTVSQMFAHCKEAFKVPLSDKPMKGYFLLGLVGPLFKKKLYSNKPWPHGLPTAPNFIIRDERDFDKEKAELLSLINRFHTEPDKAGRFRHPVFGKMNHEQWGKSMWKHLDHHLRQFGV